MDQNYDAKLTANLTKRLNRVPKPNEIVNADNDADLVNETLWQIICELNARITALETKKP